MNGDGDNRQMTNTPWSTLTDDAWRAQLLASLHTPQPGLPRFPLPRRQQTWTGFSGEATVNAAFDFYLFARQQAGALSDQPSVLDFGVGWGRCLRTWMRDVPASGLHGVDVDPEILEQARSDGVPGTLSQVAALGELPAGRHDVVISFSVFSHLSEQSSAHWLPRLAESLKPGGVMVITLLGQFFMDMCVACHDKHVDRSPWEERYARMFADPHAARAAFVRGDYAYTPQAMPTPWLVAENYGWAAMPIPFIERHVGHLATVEAFPDPGIGQNIAVIRRR